jgi:hypothetical protein
MSNVEGKADVARTFQRPLKEGINDSNLQNRAPSLQKFRVPAPSITRRSYSALPRTLLASYRIDSATRLCWLLHLGKSSALASGAFDFCSYLFGVGFLHKILASKRERLLRS